MAGTRTAPAIALWLLVLSPAVILPGGLDRFVLVKVLAVAVGVLAAIWEPPTGRLPRWAIAGMALGAALLGAAALAGGAPLAQAMGRWPRYEGLVALPAYAGAFWAGARLLGPAADAARTRTLTRAVTVLVALVGGVAVLDAVGVELLSSNVARSGSLLGNATEQGIVGALAAAVLLPAVLLPAGATAPRRTGRGSRGSRGWPDGMPVHAAALALAIVTVALSGSRGALLGLAVATATAVSLVLTPPIRRLVTADPAPARRAGRLGQRTALVGGAVVVVAVLAVLVAPGTASRVTGASPASGDTVAGRQLLWAQTADLVADHAVLGVGPSGFVEAAPEYHTVAWARTVGPANPPDSPHSWPLQALAAGGVGLLVLTLVLASLGLLAGVRALRALGASHASTDAGRRSPRAADAERAGRADRTGRAVVVVGAMAAAAGYAVAAATHFTSPGTTPLVALLAGSLCAVPALTDPVAAGSRPVLARRRAATAVVAAWLVVLTPAVMAEWQLATAYRAISAGEVAGGGAADGAFRRAQALRPWDGDVAVMAAHAFATVALAGYPDTAPVAHEWAERALDRIPTSALALAARSGAAEAAGDLPAAEADMAVLVDRAPTNPEWLLRRGVIRAGLGDVVGAEADFRQATELTDDPAPWRNLEVLLRTAGDEEGAAEATREAERRAD